MFNNNLLEKMSGVVNEYNVAGKLREVDYLKYVLSENERKLTESNQQWNDILQECYLLTMDYVNSLEQHNLVEKETDDRGNTTYHLVDGADNFTRGIEEWNYFLVFITTHNGKIVSLSLGNSIDCDNDIRVEFECHRPFLNGYVDEGNHPTSYFIDRIHNYFAYHQKKWENAK